MSSFISSMSRDREFVVVSNLGSGGEMSTVFP